MKLRFVWDEAKRAANIAKHGIDFTQARNFDFKSGLLAKDDRYDYGEDRYQSLGFIGTNLHMLVWSPRPQNTVRVISLRPATDQEIEHYGKAKK